MRRSGILPTLTELVLSLRSRVPAAAQPWSKDREPLGRVAVRDPFHAVPHRVVLVPLLDPALPGADQPSHGAVRAVASLSPHLRYTNMYSNTGHPEYCH